MEGDGRRERARRRDRRGRDMLEGSIDSEFDIQLTCDA